MTTLFSVLPQELNLRIAQFLPNSELLKYSEICRAWNRFIKGIIKIENLELASPTAFNSALIAAKKKHINGDQVTALVTPCTSAQSYYAVETIPKIFPNMKTFKVGDFSFSDADGFIQPRKIDAYKKWKSTLETLHITGPPIELGIFLKRCQFSQLTNLCLCLKFAGHEDVHRAITKLQYVPNLQTLTINMVHLTFEILQDIHNWIQPLKTLNIDSFDAFIPHNALLNGTGFRVGLTGLSLHLRWYNSGHALYSHVLQYITNNYVSLTHLKLQLLNDNAVPRERRLFLQDTELLDMVSRLPPTLVSFRHILTYTKKTHIDVLNDAVTSGRLPNLAEIVVWIPHTFLNDGTLLNYLYAKEMFTKFTSLSVIMNDFHPLNEPNLHPSNLVKLHIGPDNTRLPLVPTTCYLDNILDAHPLLRVLEIDGNHLDLSVNENFSTNRYHVEEMSLILRSLPSQTITFIRETMPGLKILKITVAEHFLSKLSSMQDINENHSMAPLALPDHHLEELHISSVASRTPVSNVICHVKSQIGDIHYLYRNGTLTRSGTELVDLAIDEDDSFYYLKVECRYLQHLNVNNVVFF